MRTIKVTFTDLADASTDTVTTSINGTDDSIRDYYLGRIFNLGGRFDPEKDRLVTATAVELGGRFDPEKDRLVTATAVELGGRFDPEKDRLVTATAVEFIN